MQNIDNEYDCYKFLITRSYINTQRRTQTNDTLILTLKRHKTVHVDITIAISPLQISKCKISTIILM